MNIKQSKYFHDIGLSATQILSIRYWLMWAIALVASILTSPHIIASIINIHIEMQVLTLGVLALILQVYVLQKAIQRAGTVKTNIINGLIPATTFLLQAIFIHQVTHINEFIFSIILSSVIILFGTLALKYR
jgi:drug/metabolite transporter (DMT)-like permease